jgi:hypothetical protein
MSAPNKISRVIATSVLHEYAIMELDNGYYPDFVQRAKKSLSAARNLQHWFTKNQGIPVSARKNMHKELLGDKLVLVYGVIDKLLLLNQEGLEAVTTELNEYLDSLPTTEHETT